MIFDKKEHKNLVIQMIEQTNFPGKILEVILEFKHAVLNAEIRSAKGEEKSD